MAAQIVKRLATGKQHDRTVVIVEVRVFKHGINPLQQRRVGLSDFSAAHQVVVAEACARRSGELGFEMLCCFVKPS